MRGLISRLLVGIVATITLGTCLSSCSPGQTPLQAWGSYNGQTVQILATEAKNLDYNQSHSVAESKLLYECDELNAVTEDDQPPHIQKVPNVRLERIWNNLITDLANVAHQCNDTDPHVWSEDVAQLEQVMPSIKDAPANNTP
jgi:hypothetical protein